MKFKMSGTLVVAAISMAVPAFAQQNVRISQDGRPERLFRTVSGLNMRDMQFVKDASASNNFEILTSKLALERGNSTFVRQFAKEMAHEHQIAQNELKLIAQRKGATLPWRLPADLQAKYNRLSRLHGNAFDREYQRQQKMAHEATSMKFKAEIRNGRDQDVKAYAVKNLPGVTMHYKMLLAKRTMTGPTKMEHGM